MKREGVAFLSLGGVGNPTMVKDPLVLLLVGQFSLVEDEKKGSKR